MNAEQQTRIDTALDQLTRTTDPAGIDAIMQAYHASAPKPPAPETHASSARPGQPPTMCPLSASAAVGLSVLVLTPATTSKSASATAS